MKSKKKIWLFLVFLFVIFSISHISEVTAVKYNGDVTTTLTDSEGLDVEIANIVPSDTLKIEEYIKANLDSNLVENDKLEAKDIIMVKNILADESLLGGNNTVTDMWKNVPEAYLFLNYYYMPLYETSEESEYYVAYINSMKFDVNSKLRDVCFAYSNVNGQVITDGVYYDENTGLAYISKKYLQENKNGEDVANVQVELFQAVNSSMPNTTFTLNVVKDENVLGKVAESGYASVEAMATEFGIKLALDNDAINSIDASKIKVVINGTETHQYDYYTGAGILVIKDMPGNVNTIEINISDENITENEYYMAQQMISPQASFTDIPFYTEAGEWTVNDTPQEGALIKIYRDRDDTFVYYDAWHHGDLVNGNKVPGLPLYGHSGNWLEMPSVIKNGTPIDLNNLVNWYGWIQWNIELHSDITTTDDKGLEWQIPAGVWQLKCADVRTSLDVPNFVTGEFGTDNQEIAKVFWIRIYKVTDEYLICGMVIGGNQHSQSGAGIYKIAYTTGSKRGSAKLTKQHEGDLETKGEADLAGAEFEFRAAEEIYEGSTLLFRKDDLIQTVTTDSDGNTPEIKAVHSDIANKDLDGLPIGNYYYKETKAPTGYNLNPNPVNVSIVEVETEEEFFPCVGVTIADRPISNGFELWKSIGETSNSRTEAVAGAQFTATADEGGKQYVSNISGTDGYCAIENLPYGHYTISETKVPENTRPCSDFKLFVEEDSSERGKYTIEEVEFVDPKNTYEDIAKDWVVDGRLIDEPEVMKLKIRKQDQDILDSDPVYKAQGDAHLEGAKYQVYQWNNDTNTYEKTKRLNGEDYIITVNHQDEEKYWVAETDDLLIGKYMVKEIVKYSAPGKDGVTYKYSYADGYKVDEKEHYFEAKPEEQNTRISYHSSISKEPVVRGSAKVVKYDNQKNNSSDDNNPSTEVPSKGAVLRLVLNSSIPASAKLEKGKETEYYMQGTVWYEVKLDENGSGEFMEVNDETHWTSVDPTYGSKYADYKIGDIDGKYTYCCTIPFGEYTLIENKESDYSENTHFYIKPQAVTIVEQTDITYEIESDEPVPMYLKIQKRDTDTGATVNLTGTKFKVWDCQNNEFVTQLSTKDEDFISVFETNEEGLITMPEQLLAGEYIVYEVDPPQGYYWEDDLRVPTNPNDVGVIGKGGKHIVIDKNAMNIRIDTISNKEYYYYTVDISDRPLKGKIEVIKTGEMLDGFNLVDKDIKANNTKYSVTNPTYKYKGLKDVEYTITAKYDIKSPDGRITYETAGTTHVIKTDENGYAITDELYLGTYEIKETKTPLGYITDKNIPDITLVNEDKTERVKTTTKELTNKKQPTQVEVEKVLENPEYDIKEDHIGVVIGIYANEDLYIADGTKIISKDTLLDVVEGKINTADIENGKNSITLTSKVNLPNNKTYYAKELYVDYPYEMETEKQVFEVKAKNTDDEVLKVYGITINNEVMDTAELAFIKISTSAIINEAKVLYGGVLTQAEYDKIMDPILKWVQRNSASTVKAVFNGEQEPDDPNVAKCRLDTKYTLSGAVYSIYYDENKTEPLTKDGVPVTVKTDEKGFASLPEVPIGEYYIFEEVAPVLIWKDEARDKDIAISYEKSKEPIKVSLSLEDKEKSIARLFTDNIDGSTNLRFTKEDIFTGELIPECIFEITNSEGEVVVNAMTNEDGRFFVNLDWFYEGETYFYREISAPGIYNLNTEPHEFKIEFDENGKLIPIPVENTRKTRDLMVRKTDSKTGEVLQGCVFTIAMINEDGSQKYHAETGEPIYLVENAVTDENGEYYIEDAPMGTYMFTEITPPEGYELDEDLTGYTFTLDENSPELTIFEVTNTGDIAVIALACVAVVCVLGIVFVVIKNKKSSKK